LNILLSLAVEEEVTVTRWRLVGLAVLEAIEPTSLVKHLEEERPLKAHLT
jgi:hypothetical protein